MNCSDFNRFLDRYTNLNAEEKDYMNNHAAICENCRKELEFFNAINKTAASLPCPPAPVDLLERINKEIDRIEETEPVRFKFTDKFARNIKKNVRYYAAFAACLAVGITVAINGNVYVDRMNNNDDGVIETTETTTVDNGVPPATDEPKKAEEIEETTPVAEAAVIKKDVKTDVPVTEIPKEPMAEVKPAQKPVVKAESKATAKPTENPTMVAPTQSATKAPVHEETAQPETEVPEEPKAAKSNYTVERGVYTLPAATETPTESVAPDKSLDSYSLSSSGRSVAMGESEKVRENLIVSVKDYGAIISIMNEMGIEYIPSSGDSSGYYRAAEDLFYSILARLSAEGIDFNFTYGNAVDGVVEFGISAY